MDSWIVLEYIREELFRIWMDSRFMKRILVLGVFILFCLGFAFAGNQLDESIPAELFDIRMDLEETVLEKASDVEAVVTYESFGRVPTPVDLTFEVFDEDENSVYLKKDDIVVTVEEVRRYNFPDMELEPGRYKFVFKTIYNVDVFDEFTQFFEVKKKGFFARIFGWLFG